MVKFNNKMQWAVSAFFAVLILFGTFNRIFAIVAFLGVCLLMFVCDRESILQQLFFIMPMANIFKMAPGSQSFFTIVLLLYVAMYFVLPRKATLLIVLFSCYIIIGQLASGGFMLFRTVKLICNILFLSSVLNHKVQLDHKRIFFSYIIGNIAASCFGLLKDSSFFNIKAYVGEIEVGGVEYIGITRFTGLYTDPNYYTVGIIICLCLIVVLYHRSEIKTFFAILLSVPIVYFLILTYSKSAILMMAIPLGCLLYSLFKKRKIITFSFLVIAGALTVLLALSGKIEALSIVIDRFNVSESAESVDINSLTTGRLEHWLMYVKYLLNNMRPLLFGEGINASFLNERAAHNTYCDMLYFLGSIGTILLILLLIVILRQSKRKTFKKTPMNYCVLACVLIMYFFLSELFYYDPSFHIFLTFVVLGLPFNEDRSNIKTVKHIQGENYA